MKANQEQLSLETFAFETTRKERLLRLFEKLEERERNMVKALPFTQRKYTRKINDHGIVAKVSRDSIIWLRENGEKLTIPLTEEICQSLRNDDVLMMCIGKRANEWRVLFLGIIASPVKAGGETQYSVSGKPRILN